ncbi:hypothetical protein GF420_12630 [candidate division GN15 bacterium]|nr:hypothetical protein [candidate division GN15 bacterium]
MSRRLKLLAVVLAAVGIWVACQPTRSTDTFTIELFEDDFGFGGGMYFCEIDVADSTAARFANWSGIRPDVVHQVGFEMRLSNTTSDTVRFTLFGAPGATGRAMTPQEAAARSTASVGPLIVPPQTRYRLTYGRSFGLSGPDAAWRHLVQDGHFYLYGVNSEPPLPPSLSIDSLALVVLLTYDDF